MYGTTDTVRNYHANDAFEAENEVQMAEKSMQSNEKKLLKTKERETWSGQFDFFLSALGYAVGLGAVWRFPYLCFKNGGGVFLIPYFVFLFLVGIPLVFLELCVGQYTSSGPLTCWVMAPVFRGVGISMNIVNTYLTIYYNMIIAYSLYYFILSLNAVLPWQYCNSKWSSPNCVDNYDPSVFNFVKCNSTTSLKCDDGKCYNLFQNTSSQSIHASCNDTSELNSTGWWHPIYPSADYWNNVILQKSNSINETGILIWQLVLALFIGWIIVFGMVVKGIKVSGKIVYFTSLFPYVVLLILGIRGWLLDGADIGIKFYILPDFSKLSNVQVWYDAANQIFFTLSVSYGGLVALASYNKFTTNVMRDAIFVSLSNCLTSVFAGFVIFAYLGYIAKESGQSIEDVIQQGQGLAFIVYPYAVTTMKVAPLWSVLFFIMLLLLGLDTMMASVEIILTSLFDLLPMLKKTNLRRTCVVACICFCTFLLGLTFCTQSGSYWVEVVDSYSGGWAVLLVGAVECISVTWFYGFDNFRNDITPMLGKSITHSRFFVIWQILWTVVSPVILIVLVVFAIIKTERLTSGDYTYPEWTEIIGIMMTVSTLIGTVIWAMYMLIDAIFINKRPLKTLITPNEKWKPLRYEDQELVRAYREKLEKHGNPIGKYNESFDVGHLDRI